MPIILFQKPPQAPIAIRFEHQQGQHIVMENSVLWPATCYNGEWMYFDTGSQLVYPVISWNCAERSNATTAVSWKTELDVSRKLPATGTTTSMPTDSTKSASPRSTESSMALMNENPGKTSDQAPEQTTTTFAAISTRTAATTILDSDSSKTPAQKASETSATTVTTGLRTALTGAKTLETTQVPSSTKAAANTLATGLLKPPTPSTDRKASITSTSLAETSAPSVTKTATTAHIASTSIAMSLTTATTTLPTTARTTEKMVTTKKLTTKKLTTKNPTTKKPTTKKPTTKKPTTKKPTTKKPTTKKPTTKKPTTKKPTTTKKTTKRRTTKKITTPKLRPPLSFAIFARGVLKDGNPYYYQTTPEMSTELASQPFLFCHSVRNHPDCGLVEFGTFITWNHGYYSVRSDLSDPDWKENTHFEYGWCARNMGSCGATVKVITSYHPQHETSRLYIGKSKTTAPWESKLLCYMWPLVNGACPR